MKENSLLSNISGIIKVLRLYIAGLIAVIAMYFLLTGVDQGIDVLIQAGEFPWAGVFTIVVVMLWAYLIWYSCRILSYTKQTKDNNISSELLQLLPRLLAYNCFVSVQVSIFHLPTYGLPLWQVYALLVGHNIFYYLLHQWFTYGKKTEKLFSWLFILVALGAYGALVYHSRNVLTYERHKFWLPVIGAIIFVVQIWILYYFIQRRKKIDARIARITASNTAGKGTLSKYLNERYAPYEQQHIRYFTVISLFAIAIYCSAIFSDYIAEYMGPMPFVMLALGVLVGLSNLISFFSIRIQINLFFFIFILAAIMGKFSDPYKVRDVDPVSPTFYSSRPSVKTYLYRWVKKREQLMDKYIAGNKKFPVYLVLSDGGASRAGNWVCSVMSSLQDSSYARDTGDLFSDHLLAISGASGGSVGNAAFYSLLRARQQHLLRDSCSGHTAQFFYADFLTFTMARLLGPDFFRHIVPIRSIMDRGAALETVLATGSVDPIIDTQLNRPLSRAFDTSGSLPIFFITTTRVQDGMPCILSPVKLPHNSQRKDVTELFGDRDIRFATAAILSSRFPYVSPAANLNENYFVDGGYVDNAGSGIMLDLLQELEEIAKDITDTTSDSAKLFTKYRQIVTFHVVHIYNSPETETKFSRINPLTNDMVTPLLTLAGMQGSSTLLYTGSLKQYFKDFNDDTSNAIINYSLYVKGEKQEAYPMSWVISCYQLERMHRRLFNANIENKSKFWFLSRN
jgi:predicted acylesterase/phospholipase RssA